MKTVIKHQFGETEVDIIYQKDIFILRRCVSHISDNWDKKYNISVYNPTKGQHVVLMRLNNWKLGRKIAIQINKTLSKDEKKILSTESSENFKSIFEKVKPIIHSYFRGNDIPFYVTRRWYRNSKYSYCYRE